MPTPAQSRAVDTSNMRRISAPLPVQPPPQMPPDLPQHLKLSPVFISSLPAMSTDVDGITRQFYGKTIVPTRRSILP
jgi:hypothetical protein